MRKIFFVLIVQMTTFAASAMPLGQACYLEKLKIAIQIPPSLLGSICPVGNYEGVVVHGVGLTIEEANQVLKERQKNQQGRNL